MRRKFTAIICLIIALISSLVLFACTPPPLSASEIFGRYASSLVCIEFETGGAWSKATAVVVDSDDEFVTAVTCYHAINYAFTSAQAKFYDDEITPISAQTYEVIDTDENYDLALIKIKKANFKGRKATFNAISTQKIGDGVFVMGNEKGEGITFDDGHIKMVDEVKSYYGSSKPLTRVSVSFTAGYSGGVVVNTNGAIVGIAVANDSANANRGYFISSNIVSAFISRAGEEYESPTISQLEYAENEVFKTKTCVEINGTTYDYIGGKLYLNDAQLTTVNGKAIDSSLSGFIAQVMLTTGNLTIN